MYNVKPYTCDCVLNLDETNHAGEFVSECQAHKDMGFTANEVLAEHVAIQLDAIKQHKPIRRAIRRVKSWF